jgi:signal peptidase II
LRALRVGTQCRSRGLSRKWWIVSGSVAAIVLVDQASKQLIHHSLRLYQSLPIIDGFFNLTYVRNTGAAFGIFAGSAEIYRRPFLIAVSIIAIGVIVMMVRRLSAKNIGLATALSFILGGAIGNLIDRVLHGEVIDFLDCYWGIYHWPAFNIADSFITVGVTITLIILLRSGETDPFASN